MSRASSAIRGAAVSAAALLVLAAVPPAAAGQAEPPPIPSETREGAGRLIDAALADSAAFERLAELVDRFGPRFSGTLALERAIDWILDEMASDGLESVHGQPVLVPRWVRGEESATLLHPHRRDLPMLGLGGSVGTPPGGITAQVLVVETFDELERRADEAPGRIVLFDAPFTSYGETVRYRTRGAVAAARAGAVASLIRSVGPYSMQTPHTGGMSYGPGTWARAPWTTGEEAWPRGRPSA